MISIKRNALLSIIMIFLLLVTTIAGKAQIALKIGDKVPDVTFTKVRNYHKATLKLSDFKGKLVIIDFWNKWCVPCISAFPKMEQLQQKFGDKIQILLVTSDTEEQLRSLFQTSEIVKKVKLPIVTSDITLGKLFPHTAVPYHVWIDKEGLMIGGLSDHNTSSETIAEYLKTGKASFTIRPQFTFSHEVKYGPLLNQMIGEGYNQLKQIQSYTLFTKWNLYNPGSMLLADTLSKRILNFSIVDFFHTAYINTPVALAVKNDAPKTVLPLKISIFAKSPTNISKYFFPKKGTQGYDKWMNENVFCYERVFEPSIMKQPAAVRYKIQDSLMIGDFERFFSIKSKIENKNEKCWVLYKKGSIEQFKAKGTDKIQEKTKDGIIRLRNEPIGSLQSIVTGYFMRYAGDMPFVDEVGYNGGIDVEFRVGENPTIETLNQDLNHYGLGIREEIRPVRLLTLTEL